MSPHSIVDCPDFVFLPIPPSYVQQVTSMLQSAYGEVGNNAEEDNSVAIEDHTMGGGYNSEVETLWMIICVCIHYPIQTSCLRWSPPANLPHTALLFELRKSA